MKLAVLVPLATAVVLATGSADADTTCDSLETLAGRLNADFGEQQKWFGLAPGGRMLNILFSNDVAETWTLVGVTPEGCAVILLYGDASTWAPVGQAS